MCSAADNSNRSPVLGCIADDVTGATDLAINLVQGGMRVVQVFGVPDAEQLAQLRDVDAIVVALKTRSIPAADAKVQSVASLRVLQQQGIDRFYFKYCSTFDSTPRGNIGPVTEALMDELAAEQSIFCPAFPRAGRTVYRGHLFVGDSLLCESGMQLHPLNPMDDANLVRVLGKQSHRKVGLLSYDSLSGDPAVVGNRLKQLAADDVALVITDACDDSHLATLARAAATMPLITGGSGLARYLPQAYAENGTLESSDFVPGIPQVSGRSLVVAGSCSSATNAQVQRMQKSCPAWQVDVAAVMKDAPAELARVADWAKATDSRQPLLVSSTALPECVAELQSHFGREAVASAVEQFLGTVANSLVKELGVRRLVLAGGETSGAIVHALGVRTLHIGPEICAGVPWTETIIDQSRLALALKSGNFGDEDFFETALEMLP